jgi:hypothetical protein
MDKPRMNLVSVDYFINRHDVCEGTFKRIPEDALGKSNVVLISDVS